MASPFASFFSAAASMTSPFPTSPRVAAPAPAPAPPSSASSSVSSASSSSFTSRAPFAANASPFSPPASMLHDEEDDHAARIWRELVESSVECELCNEPYDESDEHMPRLLSCGHTFCQSCLEDWSSVGASAGLSAAPTQLAGVPPELVAAMDCPTCRRVTTYNSAEGARSLPKNFELLRVRQEIESQTPQQLEKIKQLWTTQVLEKERLAREAEQHAIQAQRESDEAAQRARSLERQVEINEQEKRDAQEAAEDARRRALLASQRAEALQAETDQLKQRLQYEAQQLQRVKKDASSAAAVAAELHSRAEQLEQQVEKVRAQLSLHSGRHDPSKLVVLVVEPTTVGSWLLPYTRYAVISIASDATRMDPYVAAKTWTMMRQVAEPSSSVRVYRRYSDFVWLHHELRWKFPFELVPSIPGKQLFFNKDKEFVGERMRSLQAFLREILRHPVLATADDVRAFLLSTTEELEALRNASRALLGTDADMRDDDAFLREFCFVISSPRQSAERLVDTIRDKLDRGTPVIKQLGVGCDVGIHEQRGQAVANGSTSNGGGDDRVERSLSASLSALENDTVDDPEDPEFSRKRRETAEMRRKYIEIAHGHSSVTARGAQVSRAERRYSHHLHRLCELVHEMDALDRTSSQQRRERLAISMMEHSTYTPQQMDNDSRALFESQSFMARASEALSALSLSTRHDAECMEYALLEVSRMQTLELGAIEDAFTRLRTKEEAVDRAVQAATTGGESYLAPLTPSAGIMSPSSQPMSPSMLANRKNELRLRREDLMDKVQKLDPARARFVLETLQHNVAEMQQLAHARRKLCEATKKQLLASPARTSTR
ncbi:hypothetical protein P43SY_008471 [Pythium insidiosum]|uniref:PX domain-containing protein n=1 Tax=Pythium insidiosum TaxID=114742 RepID=A0AAD5QF88_PYTIN|nr:hypothetical protein P43SY_008471 [Pythium insidiosum]